MQTSRLPYISRQLNSEAKTYNLKNEAKSISYSFNDSGD